MIGAEASIRGSKRISAASAEFEFLDLLENRIYTRERSTERRKAA